MTEQVPRLRATRAGHKGVVTKLIGESEEILDSETKELDVKTCTCLGRIKATLITDLGEKIITVCDVEEIEKEIEDAEALKMRIMDAIENISTSGTPSIPTQNTLSVQEVQQASSINDNLNHSASMSSASPPTLHYPTASPTIPPLQSLKTRLPKITLAKFKGEATQFRSFGDSFESTIHSNPGLTKIDKFNYLISLLEGAASRSVAGLPITEHNYDAAIDIIHNRFGKTQQLVSGTVTEVTLLPFANLNCVINN